MVSGRFGALMAEQLEASGLPVTVVDVHPERLPAYEKAVLGRGTEAHTLEAAGIAEAEGIIAATGDDMDNLSILMTARNLNPRLFFVARQDRRQHDELFDSSGADLVARRSLHCCPENPVRGFHPFIAVIHAAPDPHRRQFCRKDCSQAEGCIAESRTEHLGDSS